MQINKYMAGFCPECGSLILRKKPATIAVCKNCFMFRRKAVEVALKPAEEVCPDIVRVKIREDVYAKIYWLAVENGVSFFQLVQALFEEALQKAARISVMLEKESHIYIKEQIFEWISQLADERGVDVNQLAESFLLAGIAREKACEWAEATFAERAAKGEKAERIVKKWLEKKGCIVYMFPHPQKLTESEIPTELKIAFKNWPQPPDGIARTPQGQAFFFDVKFKSKRLFVVNQSDYDRYFALSKVLPVKVFFYIDRKPPQLYVHNVRNPCNFNVTWMWDRNAVYLIPEKLVKKIEDFEMEAEF